MVKQTPPPILVLGAGSWGTALAIHMASNARRVFLWGRNKKTQHEWQNARENKQYLPGLNFPESLTCIDSLEQGLYECKDVMVVVPSHAFKQTILAIQPYLQTGTNIVTATKGLIPETSQLQHELVYEVLGEQQGFAVFSGPSFAGELAKGLPTAVTLSANELEYAASLRSWLHNENCRVYVNDDVIGTQIGGATKNVFAIACGISDGLGFGANARAALITRSLAEMVRLAKVLGGREETLMGLAGIGDLILTATDNQSRNRRYGLGLGQGKSSEQVIKEIGQVIEGIGTTQQIIALAKQHQVDMPITAQVNQVLRGEVSVDAAVNALLQRHPKVE